MESNETPQPASVEPLTEIEGESGARGIRWWRLGIVAFLSGGMLAFHYVTPATDHQAILHDLYRRLLYIPIILASFWFGWRGGVLCALLISAAYFPHIYHDWGGDFLDRNLNRTLEACMYVVVGGITGYLVDYLRREQRNLQSVNEALAMQSKELHRAMQELRQKTREVFEAEEQLRRADRLAALGQLTAGLAHEIRNPLGSIRGAAEILDDPNVPGEKRRDFGRILMEETRRLDKVLSNFLDYAQKQRPRDGQRCEFGAVLEQLMALLAKQLSDAGICVETEVAEELPSLAISGPLLQQVLMNLALNALQAMPGGGELRIVAGRHESGNFARIAVTDSGAGISETIADRIFDPFVTDKPHGTGLGLSIVHKIVAGQKGRIAVDKAYTNGAKFIILLPLVCSNNVGRLEQ